MIDEEDVNDLWFKDVNDLWCKVVESDGVFFRDTEEDSSADDHIGLTLIHNVTWTDMGFDEIMDLQELQLFNF